ncbi:MAG TPA: lipid-binding SYLF domain-containing protein [Blastocatellia bacterium]|nr:lipid-binding SYLF domain-containing protein [Blastocatellia bacterium]
MKTRSILNLTCAFVLTLSTAVAVSAQGSKEADIKDEIKQSQKAATAFTEIMNAPDKGIPQNIIDDAECVAVFPEVIKAGFIVGGRGGRGVASCRVGNAWSAPLYMHLGGGSVGLQIGAQATDFVLLFMDRDGIDSLLKDKFTLGADASAAAGPVGRQAGAETDVKLNAKILSYSRSKGLFAGLELKGVVIETDKSDTRDVYGEGYNSREILTENKATVPPGVRAFPNTLTKFSTRKAEKATR